MEESVPNTRTKPEGLEKLTKFFQENTILVEVGSHTGASAEIFVKSQKMKKIYCVDSWNNSVYGEKAESIFDKFVEKYKEVEKIKLKSVEAAKMFSNESIDAVYIDAEHTYEAVKQDIDAWFPKVKDGGIIAGHDYHMEAVKRAVDEFFESSDVRIEGFAEWLCYKK